MSFIVEVHADDHVHRDRDDPYNHCQRRGNGAVGRLGDDDPEALKLHREVRHHRQHGDQRDDHAETGAPVLAHEKIRLGVEPVLLGIAPHGGQEPVAHHVRQSPVGEDVERRPTPTVGPAARSQKGEGRIDLAGQEQEYEDGPETPPSDAPLFEVHVLATPGPDAEVDREGQKREDDQECDVHSASSSLFAGSSW